MKKWYPFDSDLRPDSAGFSWERCRPPIGIRPGPSNLLFLLVPGGPRTWVRGRTAIFLRSTSRSLFQRSNRPGGTGIQGTTYVIKSKKDGYTLLGSTDTPLMIMPVISKEVTYDPIKDVVPIGYFGYAPAIFAVRADSPFKTLAELIEFVRKNPGRIKNASAGVGAESQFNLQLLCHKENLKIGSVPFKSGGEAVVALLGGHTDMSSNTVASLGPHLKAGTLRGLAISSKKRHPDFPGVPTTAELGHPDVNFEVWLALFAPRGVPQEVIDVLVPATEKAFKDPEARQRAMNAGLVVDYMGPDETAKLLESGLATIRKVAAAAELTK